MSIEEFSEAYGFDPTTVEKLEGGKLLQNKSIDVLYRALRVPGVAASLAHREDRLPVPEPVDTEAVFKNLDPGSEYDGI